LHAAEIGTDAEGLARAGQQQASHVRFATQAREQRSQGLLQSQAQRVEAGRFIEGGNADMADSFEAQDFFAHAVLRLTDVR